ncbi:hypothetical protein IY145_00590 [Methylosinus sp. H3A]|uniref:hypothetical protein n=1 Tax=Methylosinus sp. H3A TaxID=2785786 RepID=UPI0018C23725|nr:hypothetical protein [Methylosinus sp. H3A]MBG0807930.1 hypothetical protein [Methylosinus sp. H3A]
MAELLDHDRCVRFAAVVAFRAATLATSRALPLSWAGLAPAGTRQLRLAHLIQIAAAYCRNGCLAGCLKRGILFGEFDRFVDAANVFGERQGRIPQGDRQCVACDCFPLTSQRRSHFAVGKHPP